jgi:hypothetical protein
MHRWYVKARYQEDHDERAAALGCDCVLEDTSSQVNWDYALPHVIVQAGRVVDGIYSEPNIVFPEPVTKAELDAVPVDEPNPANNPSDPDSSGEE